MKKLLLLIFLFSFFINPSFAWGKKPKNLLYFGNSIDEIEKSVIDKIETKDVFKVGNKIYFLAYIPEGFKSDYIKYQIVKQDDNAHVAGYTRIRNITCRIKNKNYYSDYFIIYETGKYYLQVFDIQNLHQWLVIGGFKIVE